mmetsp:Transcript_3202/g.10587  ORF Transcript_3202/g.10587 Transcript_3202/m.10587 type:complete len:293 (-) Transcript_3202:885-1763(-)
MLRLHPYAKGQIPIRSFRPRPLSKGDDALRAASRRPPLGEGIHRNVTERNVRHPESLRVDDVRREAAGQRELDNGRRPLRLGLHRQLLATTRMRPLLFVSPRGRRLGKGGEVVVVVVVVIVIQPKCRGVLSFGGSKEVAAPGRVVHLLGLRLGGLALNFRVDRQEVRERHSRRQRAQGRAQEPRPNPREFHGLDVDPPISHLVVDLRRIEREVAWVAKCFLRTWACCASERTDRKKERKGVPSLRFIRVGHKTMTLEVAGGWDGRGGKLHFEPLPQPAPGERRLVKVLVEVL